MSKPTLYVQRLSEAAVLPKRGSALAAGWDLAAAKACVVPAKGRAIVATDLSIATPEDCYARIAPRSGLAVKKFIDVGAGVVDADYRGAVGVVLFNHGEEDFAVAAGDRVADLALSDAWFGWYFAPGGVVLGPALFFTVFIVGQALVERRGGEPSAGLDVAQRHNHNIRARAGVLLRAHAHVRRLDDRAVPGSFARARNSFHN